MMEPQARYTVVGAAVLLLAALAAGVAVWLLRSGNGPDVRLYTVYFARQSLAGVQENGEVLMKGLRVGTVRQFAFSDRHAGTVEMVLELAANAPVRASSRAVIDRNLITGAASVDLVTADESSPRLLRVPAGEAHPVIAEGESDVEQFRQTVTQLGQRADEALQRVSATLSAGNRAALSDTLVAIGRAAQALEATTRQASGDLHRLADRYDQLGAQAASRLDDASAVVQQVGGDVARLARRAEGLAENADIELRVTGEKVRSAADALADTSRGLGNPRALLFGPAAGSLGPGEEMP